MAPDIFCSYISDRTIEEIQERDEAQQCRISQLRTERDDLLAALEQQEERCPADSNSQKYYETEIKALRWKCEHDAEAYAGLRVIADDLLDALEGMVDDARALATWDGVAACTCCGVAQLDGRAAVLCHYCTAREAIAKAKGE